MHALHRLAMLLGLLTLSQVSLAQLDTSWTARVINGSANVNLRAVTLLTNGDFAACGFQSLTAGDTDLFVARVSANGTMLWMRTLRGTNQEQGSGLTELQSGNLMIVGFNAARSSTGFLLWGISAQGDSLWSRNYAGGVTAKGFGICRLPDGNALAVGYRMVATQTRLFYLKLRPTGDTLWTRTYAGSGGTYGFRVMPGPDGTLAIGGYRDNGSSTNDFWLLRTDSLGNEISSATASDAGADDVCYGMTISNGEIYLGGRSSIGATNREMLAKFRPYGTYAWSTTYDNPNWPQELLRDIAALPNGGVFCVGWNTLSSDNDYSPLALIADSTGASQNVRSYNLYGGQLWGLCPTAGRLGFYAVGNIQTGAQTTGLVVRFAQAAGISGTVRRIFDQSPIISSRVSVLGQGTYTYTGSQGEFHLVLGIGHYDLIATADCMAADTAFDVEVFPDSMSVSDFALGTPRMICRQTSLNGVVHNRVPARIPLTLWNSGEATLLIRTAVQMVRPANAWLSVDPPMAGIEPGDSLVVQATITPDTTNSGAFDYDGFVVVHNNTCPDSVVLIPILVTVLDAELQSAALPTQFALHPAYPNPFNAVTTITLDLPRSTMVSVNLYDMLGRQVRQLLNEPLFAGSHRLHFNAAELPSGIYFVRMRAGEFVGSQKIVLIR